MHTGPDSPHYHKKPESRKAKKPSTHSVFQLLLCTYHAQGPGPWVTGTPLPSHPLFQPSVFRPSVEVCAAIPTHFHLGSVGSHLLASSASIRSRSGNESSQSRMVSLSSPLWQSGKGVRGCPPPHRWRVRGKSPTYRPEVPWPWPRCRAGLWP